MAQFQIYGVGIGQDIMLRVLGRVFCRQCRILGDQLRDIIRDKIGETAGVCIDPSDGIRQTLQAVDYCAAHMTGTVNPDGLQGLGDRLDKPAVFELKLRGFGTLTHMCQGAFQPKWFGQIFAS